MRLDPLPDLAHAVGMASLKMKIKAEHTMRELLEQNGLPEPDEVEYGFGCIRLFWHGAKAVVIIDIDEAGELGETRPGQFQPS
jgi:hypothetical protein